MKTPTRRLPAVRLGRRESGLTLIEMCITITIALFLLGGLATILQNVRRTYANQTQLSQLQDSERMAMTLITDVVQSAGYFPNPAINTVSAALPQVGTTFVATQSITGVQAAVAPEDSISIRYMTADKDGILNCLGTSNTTGAPVTYTNTFSLTSLDATGTRSLQCALSDGVNTTTQPLVSGLLNMKVFYGVKRNTATTDSNVDSYVRANDMLAADWLNISAIRIIFTFQNPLAAPTSPKTITFERVVAVMNRAGVTL